MAQTASASIETLSITTMSASINSDVALLTEHLTYRPAVCIHHPKERVLSSLANLSNPTGPNRRHSKQHQHPRLQSNRRRRSRPHARLPSRPRNQDPLLSHRRRNRCTALQDKTRDRKWRPPIRNPVGGENRQEFRQAGTLELEEYLVCAARGEGLGALESL